VASAWPCLFPDATRGFTDPGPYGMAGPLEPEQGQEEEEEEEQQQQQQQQQEHDARNRWLGSGARKLTTRGPSSWPGPVTWRLAWLRAGPVTWRLATCWPRHVAAVLHQGWGVLAVAMLHDLLQGYQKHVAERRRAAARARSSVTGACAMVLCMHGRARYGRAAAPDGPCAAVLPRRTGPVRPCCRAGRAR
jgi:hypothetical protein